MDIAFVSQIVVSGLILAVIYALVAVGFTLFVGVFNVLNFSHGDVLMFGAFAGFTAFLPLAGLGVTSPFLQLVLVTIASITCTIALGLVVARFFILPLKGAPMLNTLLITLMLATAIREGVRLFYPRGSNPKAFPALLPTDFVSIGAVNVRLDTIILIVAGLAIIVATGALIERTRFGLAIRAVAQDEETARCMGVNYRLVVLGAFALGSALAACAALINGLYYNEVNYSMGLMLAIIGFCAAIIGGLGNIAGAILGAFIFAGLQIVGSLFMPFSSAYSDVFAFAVILVLIALKPTGLIGERVSERV